MDGSGYAQAGAATFTTAVNWILYGAESKDIEKARQEELGLAQQARADALRQQQVENRFATLGAELQQAGFDFGKQKWGDEFGLTKKQALLNMKLAKKQEGRTQEAWDIDKRKSSLAQLTSNLNSILGNDITMKKLVASRMGA